jgi:hypothetical protein
MLRTRAVPALLLAFIAATPACRSDHRVPAMDERAAVPRTAPMPQAPAGTIYPRPAAVASEAAAAAAPVVEPAQPLPEADAAPLAPGVAPAAPPVAPQPPAGSEDEHAGHDGR